MPRPKKDPAVLKDEVLRIPVSADEKKYISDAALAIEGEFARWARPILLKAAEEYYRALGSEKPHAQGNEAKKKSRVSASILA